MKKSKEDTVRVKCRLLATSGTYKFPDGTILTPSKPVGELPKDLVDKFDYLEEEEDDRVRVRTRPVSGGQTTEEDRES